MPFDKYLVARVVDALIPEPSIIKKKMFGGVCFMQDGLAFAGVWGDGLIVRVGPDAYHAALCEPHVREFDITGKPMRGWVVVGPDGVDSDAELRNWLRRAIDFTGQLPRAGSSPRKRRSKGS
jgi:hypothetical protein